MEKSRIGALDEDLITVVLRFVDPLKTRATMACVCKTWRSCVQRTLDRAHLCFDSEEALRTQITWLACRQDSPLLLHTLELHNSMPTTLPSWLSGQAFLQLTHIHSACIQDYP